MLFQKKKQIKDERIEKESQKATAVAFYVITLELLICLVVKLVLAEPWYNVTLELLCLVAGCGYAVIKKLVDGVPFFKTEDEALKEISNRILTKAFTIQFVLLVFGELVYMFALTGGENAGWSKEMTWLMIYLIIWVIPGSVFTVLAIKRGWLIWGSKKQETVGKKELAKRTAIGSLFFGLVMGAPELVKDGVFQPKGLLVVFGMAVTWGILFYVMFAGMIKFSEKNADKSVEEKEENSEE